MRVTINENDCGCATCGNIGNSDICAECSWDSKWEPKPVTNGDRIRAMTDAELAEWLVSFGTICEICSENTFVYDDETIACGRCAEGITNWLKQPAKEVT